MGWSGGSRVFEEAWSGVRDYVPEDKRVEACMKVIDALENEDWDTQDEVSHSFPEVEDALKRLHPDWYEEEEESA